MEMLTSKIEASFYCNRCDKWVDGIEDEENSPAIAGMKQVLCDECGGASSTGLQPSGRSSSAGRPNSLEMPLARGRNSPRGKLPDSPLRSHAHT